MVKYIPLQRKDLHVSVDDEVYDELMKYTWIVQNNHGVLDVTRREGTKGVRMIREIIEVPANSDLYPILKDRNPLNLTRDNIILVDKDALIRSRGVRKNNVHGYKGVGRERNRFKAMLTSGGEVLHRSYHSTTDEAAKAYNEAVIEHFGENSGAFLNVIGVDNRNSEINIRREYASNRSKNHVGERKSKYRGVTKYNGKYLVIIDGKMLYENKYDIEEEAAKKYNELVIQKYGEDYPYINKIY